MKTNPPIKVRNIERRSREYLTPDEVDKLITAARKIGRHRHRDSTMILVAYRHALRVSELIALRWSQIDLDTGLIQVNRLKNGISCAHPLFGPEIRPCT
jgi:integrase